jgi:hypothetical protein
MDVAFRRQKRDLYRSLTRHPNPRGSQRRVGKALAEDIGQDPPTTVLCRAIAYGLSAERGKGDEHDPSI